MALRIGIDVGGTNTDAVLMDGNEVIAKIKTPTTEDVTSGITTALRHVLDSSGTATAQIAGVMIGTTHFTNAVVERRRLEPTAIIRLGLPATAALPPFVDWPDDLADTLGRHALPGQGRPRVRRPRDLAAGRRRRSNGSPASSRTRDHRPSPSPRSSPRSTRRWSRRRRPS